MAVGLQRFSIREYVAKIRDVDVGKCWPFERREEKEGEGLLPEMVCRRYRWWESELETARSECQEPGRGGISGVGKVVVEGERGDRVVEEEGDEGVVCVGTVTRAPKKRSIVELFAVAPQIAGGGEGEREELEEGVDKDLVEKEEEDDDDDEREAGVKKNKKGKFVEILMRKKKKKKEKKKKKQKVVDKKQTSKKMKKYQGKNDNNSINNNKVKSTGKKQQIRPTPSDKKSRVGRKLGRKLRLKNKEKTHKINLTSGIDISQLVPGSIIKRFGNEVANQHVDGKPPAAIILPKKKKQKETATTKSSLKKEHGKSSSSVHRILKDQKRHVSSDKTNGSQTLCKTTPAKHVHVRQQKKRSKDDILGPKNKCGSSLKTAPVQTLCKVFSDALTISEMPENLCGDEKQAPAVDGIGEIFADDTRVTMITSVDKTHQTSPYPSELPKTNCPSTNDMIGLSDHPKSGEMEKTVHSVDLNHSIHDDVDLLEACTSLAPPDHMCSGSSFQFAKLGSDAASSQPLGGGCSVKQVSDYVSKSSAVGSISYVTKSDSKVSTPLLTVKKGTGGSSIQWMNASDHSCNLVPQSNPVYNVAQKDVLDGQHSAVSFEKLLHQSNLQCRSPSIQRDPPAIYNEKYRNGKFFGLPLNSQGELIQLDSHGILQTIGISEAQGSLGSFSMPTHVKPRQCLDHHSMKRRSFAFDLRGKECLLPQQSLFKDQPSGTHQTVANIYPEYTFMDINPEHQFLGQEHDHKAYQMYTDQRPSSCLTCREHDGQKTSTVKGFSDRASQSGKQTTMRLMGKNVTVGKNCKECHCLEDGKVWMDKEIINEQNTVARIPDKLFEKWNYQHELFAHSASEISKGCLVRPLDASFYRGTNDFFQKDGVDFRSQSIHLDELSHLLPRNSNRPLINGGHISRVGTFIQPQIDVPFNKFPTQPENYISGAESMKMFSQVPSASSFTYDTHQHMLLNSINCRLDQNPSSALPHAFLTMDHRNYFQQEVSARNMQRWLIDAANHRKGPIASSCTRPLSDYHHLQTISNVNLNHLSPPCTYSINSFPASDQSASRMCLPNLLMTSPLDSSLTPNSTMMDTSSQGNLKNRDGSRSWLAYHEEPHQAKNTRKRPPSEPIDVMKPTKKSNLVILDDSDDSTASRKKEPLHGCIQYTSAAPDVCSHVVKITNVNNDEKNICSSASKFGGSPKLDNGSRSGPIKLGAGAKHILKPSRNMDLDNSRPIYSSIPFAVQNDAGTVPGTRKKSAKIYQF